MVACPYSTDHHGDSIRASCITPPSLRTTGSSYSGLILRYGPDDRISDSWAVLCLLNDTVGVYIAPAGTQLRGLEKVGRARLDLAMISCDDRGNLPMGTLEERDDNVRDLGERLGPSKLLHEQGDNRTLPALAAS